LWFLNLVFFVVFLSFLFSFPVLLTSPSLFSYPYSFPLHFPPFSCVTIHCSPSQLLFLPLLIHSFPCLLSSPTLSPHYSSLLHTYHLLTSLLYRHNLSPLQSLTQAPSTTTEIHKNTQKSHEPQQLPYLFAHPPTPCPSFSATLSILQNL
jgi:hypothetical protein